MSRAVLPSGRWLVLAHDEPGAVRLESYAERLADSLRELGQEALVVRAQRGARPRSTPCLREHGVAPVPTPLTRPNQLLAGAVRLQRVLDELVRTEGPFDALLVEGALGGLVGPPLASRHHLPLVLALPTCEVGRRQNQLTREHLNLAELEHWGVGRAAAVLVPDEETAAAAREHYQATPTVVPVPVTGLGPPPHADLLLRRLGLTEPFVLVLAEEQGDRERDGIFARESEHPVVWAGTDLWVKSSSGAAPERRAGGPVAGPALGALLSAAGSVLVLDRAAERNADAQQLEHSARAGAQAGAAPTALVGVAVRILKKRKELSP